MAQPDPIVVSDLRIGYPAHGASGACEAVRGVTLRVRPGEVLGLLGESGSGKTTLARVLAGRNDDTAGVQPKIIGGEASVAGFRLRRLRRKQRTRLTFYVGYLRQDAGARLDSSSTVAELIAAPIYDRDRRFDAREVGARTAAMLDAVHLPLRMLGKYPYELSSGQRQRVAIAQSLVLGPAVLIADEPTAGIDITVRDAVMDLFDAMRASGSFAALVISHDLAVLRHSGANIAVLHDGRVVGYGPVEQVFSAPDHPYVAQLGRTLLPGQGR